MTNSSRHGPGPRPDADQTQPMATLVFDRRFAPEPSPSFPPPTDPRRERMFRTVHDARRPATTWQHRLAARRRRVQTVLFVFVAFGAGLAGTFAYARFGPGADTVLVRRVPHVAVPDTLGCTCTASAGTSVRDD